MRQSRRISSFFCAAVLTITLGCAGTSTRESTGEYLDDTAITAKVKAAIFHEPGLKSSEIKVETFKAVVQLSGFVSSDSDMSQAVRVAEGVGGVKAVKNDMRLK